MGGENDNSDSVCLFVETKGRTPARRGGGYSSKTGRDRSVLALCRYTLLYQLLRPPRIAADDFPSPLVLLLLPWRRARLRSAHGVYLLSRCHAKVLLQAQQATFILQPGERRGNGIWVVSRSSVVDCPRAQP